MPVVHDDSAFNFLLDRARAIVTKAEVEDREITPKEEAEVNDLLSKAETIKAGYERRERMAGGQLTPTQEKQLKAELRDQVESIMGSFNGPLGGGGGFAKTLFDGGLSFQHQPRVSVSLAAALGATKANVFPAATDWSRTEPVLVGMGQDQRFLFPNLVIADAGNAGSIQDFSQTARTLTGTVKRALDATTAKANVDVTLAIVNEALAQFAVTVDDVPNALFETVEPLRAFLDQEARFQVLKAIDAHVIAQIVAAGPAFGNVGADMITKIRTAIGEMRTLGADPDLVAINATDAAALDLLADAGGYIFSTRRAGDASPLFDLKLVEMPGSTPPYVIDSKMLGVLYMGSLDFAIDPFSGFAANLSTLRCEVNALYHVRNVQGARRIAAA